MSEECSFKYKGLEYTGDYEMNPDWEEYTACSIRQYHWMCLNKCVGEDKCPIVKK